jgi:hypothetical protein
MTRGTNQGTWGAVNSARLAALLDKFDIDPISTPGGKGVPVVAQNGAIRDACDMLRSAIADVRNIIA